MVNEEMAENMQPDPQAKMNRKRVRKSLTNSMNMRQSSSCEDVEMVDLTESPTKNHFSPIKRKLNTEIKKLKTEDDVEVFTIDGQPTRRSQPHRAARFTESYSNIAGGNLAVLSDDETAQNGECKEGNESSSSSDSECEIIVESPPPALSAEEHLEWKTRIEALQKQLLYEDVKLLLLKKLKQSQTKKEVKKEEVNYTVPSHVKISQRPSAGTVQETSSSSPSKKLMPSGRHQAQAKVSVSVDKISNIVQDLSKNVKVAPALAATGTSSVSSSTANNLVQYSENLNRANITIHPVNAQTASQRHKPLNSIKNEVSISLVSVPNTNSEKQQKTHHQQQHQPPPPPSKPAKEKEKELTAQQQAAAKMMLQKEIKRTLMQIPSPKSTVERPQFLPNGSSPDFVWLLGLDIVVDYLTKKKTEEFMTKDPYECSQCKTSFTEYWKTIDKTSSKNEKVLVTLCYTCYAHSMKKKLRVEHTAQLKSAFTKILQYEKEIDKLSRMPTVSAAPSNVSLTSSSSSSSSSVSNYRAPASQSYSQPMSLHKSTSSTSSSRTPPFPSNLFQGNNLLWFQQQFPKLTPQQLQTIFQQQAQNFMASGLQLSPHMLPFAPFLAQYPYQMLNKSASSASDLQRQYLLDMIPPSRSSPSSSQTHRKS